ncbi:MAG: hypothetical protein SPJ13_04460 [Bacteroidales bacterium]|nr:hypothetical protein [Bacteroidales bacterium]
MALLHADSLRGRDGRVRGRGGLRVRFRHSSPTEVGDECYHGAAMVLP